MLSGVAPIGQPIFLPGRAQKDLQIGGRVRLVAASVVASNNHNLCGSVLALD